MAAKITRDILESYLHCKYKAHLKLGSQQGIKSDFENLLTEMRANVRLAAIDKIQSTHPAEDIPRNIPITKSTLKQGASFLLDVTLEDDIFILEFDGLKKVDGPSKLGDFHYVPMLFSERQTVRKEERSLLALYGLLLSRLQGTTPVHGIVWHGNECKATKVRLNADLRSTEKLLRDLKDLCNSDSSPKLVLNDHCQVCEFRQKCLDQAVQEDNISLLRGMGEKQISNYSRKGILTTTQMAHTFRPRRRGKRAPPKENHRFHSLQALAVRDKRVYVLGTPQMPDAPVHVYLDIEGNPDEGFDYLIGVIVVDGNREQRFSYWADTKADEDRIFERFLETVTNFVNFVVFAYGNYERAFLQKMRDRANHKAPIDRVLKALVNVLSVIYSHVYFPTYSNGLKDVAACLGCSWSEPKSSGIQSIVWRKRWEATHSDELKQMLITYNLEDCFALRQITSFVRIQCGMSASGHATSGMVRGPAITSVDEFDRLGTVNRRGRKEFFHVTFAQINKCARFDYQRERVYVRSRPRRRKATARRLRKLSNHTLRANRTVEIKSRKCPSCGSTELNRPLKAHFGKGCFTKGKRAFDLAFTAGGIRRKVIDCRASVHNCLACGNIFVPERYRRLAKHFHGLTSWAMHEHIAHRISGPMVSEMIEEFFGLTVYPAEVTRFRTMMAGKYEACWKKLFQRILSSPVLQVDETEVKLRNGKGYVWVFTTVDEVVYSYRPTREGDFLHELLKGFNGVLVSDFYAAYDSLECPQQKCLLHLMRDMNQALLDNPFDEELQSITAPFGELLREIVTTIDECGLKRRQLKGHKRGVSEFFESIETQLFRSEPAESLRARLMKYRDKLFTFLDYDGVPWNNNNPENAIRRFAYYRDGNPGRLKEPGLKEYLILLSLRQTCHFKGVSFLRFLLSKERDIDAFQRMPKRNRRPFTIEIYPKGVVRPDFGGKRTHPKTPEASHISPDDIR